MRYAYKTSGTCSQKIEFDLNDGIVTNVQFPGGSPGNLKAISALVEGMTAEHIIERCEGIRCGMKPTSCSDQLVRAIKQAQAQQNA